MLYIKIDDGSLFKFPNTTYTDYIITNDFIVVKRNEQWIGVFSKEHFISLFIEDETNNTINDNTSVVEEVDTENIN